MPKNTTTTPNPFDETQDVPAEPNVDPQVTEDTEGVSGDAPAPEEPSNTDITPSDSPEPSGDAGEGSEQPPTPSTEGAETDEAKKAREIAEHKLPSDAAPFDSTLDPITPAQDSGDPVQDFDGTDEPENAASEPEWYVDEKGHVTGTANPAYRNR